MPAPAARIVDRRRHRAKRPRNTLNDLSGTEWIRFTRSWFVEHPRPRESRELQHPAKFPEGLCEAFIRFFTKRGMWVLDPFAGTGSALVAAVRAGRNAVGLDLNPGFVRSARERLSQLDSSGQGVWRVFSGDARRLALLWEAEELPSVQLVLTSPPYWDMLGKSRGGVLSVHRRRKAEGLATTYSIDDRDLATLHDYGEFLEATVGILSAAGRLLDPGRYLVLVAQNLRDIGGEVRTLAWDLARRLNGRELLFQGERIWCQDAKLLGIWGYPTTFVPNYHHHYCLVFRRAETEAG